mmetsp:Transcript_22240/g.33084  ORF Transcript_22240/g.33084 Transcript_22240/m.33084 type:complete len:632 (-) Transcript_22240:161-2056(-)|eukprot:CAMPEP_0194041380 /NCGR_PEP_ID=MMETSP0009_2-20130614/13299_1 /TAXON_ID=210454 /ORGANISM="Grammatophora oceanica, Strain CCMP 410" /LENGTH=631 /DNA_ID=CAMNT_0038684875 /DNA_START=52 /DNA_END=1947 /DNA_ORIENTATION=-
MSTSVPTTAESPTTASDAQTPTIEGDTVTEPITIEDAPSDEHYNRVDTNDNTKDEEAAISNVEEEETTNNNKNEETSTDESSSKGVQELVAIEAAATAKPEPSTEADLQKQANEMPNNTKDSYMTHTPRDADAQKRRNKRFLCYGAAIVVLLIIVGVILGIAFGKEGRASQNSSTSPGETDDTTSGSDPTQSPTSAPSLVAEPGTPSAPPVLEPYIPEVTNQPSLRPTQGTVIPTAAPSSGIKAMLISTGVALRGGGEFLDETTPQYRSLMWLESTALRSWSDAKLIRRYVLGCIYFGTFSATTASSIVFYGSTQDPEPWLNSTGWTTGEDECTWYGITCSANGDIAGITLPENRLSGRMPNEIKIFKDTLVELDLTSNIIENIGQEGLAWLGELTKLEYLYIGGNYFGYFGLPPFLGNLVELRELDVSYCSFHGPMNAELIFPNTPKLYYLEMGGNGFNSSIPDVIIDLPELERLYMDNSFLSGDLSWLSVDRVPFLFELWIDDNVGMSGSLPASIGTLSNTLASLSLTSISLGGTIPTEIGLLSNMIQLWLYDNELEGAVPTEFTALTGLRIFHIQGNPLLTGDMPVCDALPVLGDVGADCDTITPCDCCTCCSMAECGTENDNNEGTV